MKVRKTTFEQEQQEKEDAYFKLTPAERFAHYYKMLQKIYGDRLNQPLSDEARKVRIQRLDSIES